MSSFFVASRIVVVVSYDEQRCRSWQMERHKVLGSLRTMAAIVVRVRKAARALPGSSTMQ